MIVWVASFPRSGNTFFRILLHRLYEVPTYVVYDIDGVADQIGGDLMDYRPRPGTFDELRASPEVFFVKTHRQRCDPLVSEQDRAICLVRDGRDCVVSWARLRTAHQADRPDYEALFAAEARSIITRQSGGTAHWGQNVLSWHRSAAPDPIWVRYDQLIVDPLDTVRAAVAATAPGLRPLNDTSIPAFDELRDRDPAFFRVGTTGTHRSELSADLHDLFWKTTPNATTMTLLGYQR